MTTNQFALLAEESLQGSGSRLTVDTDSIFTKGTAQINMLAKKWRRSHEKNLDSAIRIWFRSTKVPAHRPTYEELERLYRFHISDVMEQWMWRMVRRKGWQIVNRSYLTIEMPPLVFEVDWDTEFTVKQKFISDPDFLSSITCKNLNGGVLDVPDNMYVIDYLKEPKKLPRAVWVK